MLGREEQEEIFNFHLRESCKLVSGTKRAAIYDLEQGKVYSINETARQIVEQKFDSEGFWQKLESVGLTEVSSRPHPEVQAQIPEVGLEFMWLELTNRCNQKCVHCYASSERKPDIRVELPTSTWQRVIEEGKNLGCTKLQFIGGEPLLYKGLMDLAITAENLGYEFVEIFTNGTLLTPKKIGNIKDLGIHVALSLYSSVPEVHDRVTQVPGSFERTYKVLQLLKEAEVPTRIAIVVMKHNQDTVLATQDFLEKIGLKSGRPDIIRPTGRGQCGELLPNNEVTQTWGLMTKPSFSTSAEEFYRNRFWNSCWAGKIAITSDGKIIPCIFAREHVVSSIANSLEEGIKGEKLQSLWKTTKDEIEGCRDCEYRYACHDCRPLAEDTTGNLYAKNPRCSYNPSSGTWNPKEEGGKKSCQSLNHTQLPRLRQRSQILQVKENQR